MKEYSHKIIESKWQKIWEKDNLYETSEDLSKPKSYVLDMFPYPSGEGLHAGHVRVYTASDIYSRYKRMNGFRVLHPTGWDAFGLPAEQFAIKNKINPKISVKNNVDNFRRQMKLLGFSYDWEREIDTTDPSFYKWTQWIFLKLYEKGLAYESFEPINWCPSCQTGLANEDLDGNECERCGTIVEKKPMRQWVLKITDYADRLVNDLDLLNGWPTAFKEAQRNWIGRSNGSLIKFNIANSKFSFDVFTTRADTLFGATYAVLSPEHELIKKLKIKIENCEEVEKYQKIASEKTEIERTADGKEKTGVKLEGIEAINPANKEKIPIYIADYVLAHYGTGAIMAVPAHDTRDYEFAIRYKLPIKEVISAQIHADLTQRVAEGIPYVGDGVLINSGKFDGMDSETARKEITKFVGGRMKTTYKLRDWTFSRQRYWGEPIPLIFCEACAKKSKAQTNPDLTQKGAERNYLNPGWVPVPEKDLPVLLPEVKSYEPTGTGESPLAEIESWVNTTCPKCGGPGKRETNTMPQWAGSSWYYFRFIDPKNNEHLVDSKKEKDWMPVDMYVGGAEHATRHLIYARFWHKFLFDIGITKEIEPFIRLESVGLILGEGGIKMSKRLGNTVNPDGIVEAYGADTLRLYAMFIGPFSQAAGWNTKNIVGPRRFLERVWRLKNKLQPITDVPTEHLTKGDNQQQKNKKTEAEFHKTIKKVGDDIKQFKFNTAISQLMVLLSAFESEENIPKYYFEIFLKLLSPFAPHITEELWNELGNKSSIHTEPWPKHDESKLAGDTYTIVVQINGKVRGSFIVPIHTSEEDIKSEALAQETTKKWLNGGIPKKVLYVPGKLVSIVV